MLVLLSRRVLFATVLTGALVAVIVAAASVKRATMNMVVHAYDFVLLLRAPGRPSAICGATTGATWWRWSQPCWRMALAAWLAYRLDSTRVSRALGRRWPLPCSSLARLVRAEAKGERRHMQFYYENLYVSSFYASWGETIEALWRGALLEAAPRAAAARRLSRIPRSCDAATKPPHIILIHQESVVQPSLFPTLRYDH